MKVLFVIFVLVTCFIYGYAKLTCLQDNVILHREVEYYINSTVACKNEIKIWKEACEIKKENNAEDLMR